MRLSHMHTHTQTRTWISSQGSVNWDQQNGRIGHDGLDEARIDSFVSGFPTVPGEEAAGWRLPQGSYGFPITWPWMMGGAWASPSLHLASKRRLPTLTRVKKVKLWLGFTSLVWECYSFMTTSVSVANVVEEWREKIVFQPHPCSSCSLRLSN